MNMEFLKTLGVSEDTALKIMEEVSMLLDLEYERGLSDGSAKIEELKLSQLIEKELLKSGCKNPEILNKIIDTSKISLEDGNILGLSEQLETIKAQNPYLFEDDIPAPHFAKRHRGSEELSRASFERMSYMDRVKLYSNNPGLYKKLKG